MSGRKRKYPRHYVIPENDAFAELNVSREERDDPEPRARRDRHDSDDSMNGSGGHQEVPEEHGADYPEEANPGSRSSGDDVDEDDDVDEAVGEEVVGRYAVGGEPIEQIAVQHDRAFDLSLIHQGITRTGQDSPAHEQNDEPLAPPDNLFDNDVHEGPHPELEHDLNCKGEIVYFFFFIP